MKREIRLTEESILVCFGESGNNYIVDNTRELVLISSHGLETFNRLVTEGYKLAHKCGWTDQYKRLTRLGKAIIALTQ